MLFKLFKLPLYQKSARVGVYLSMKDEVRTDKIVEHIIENGKECFIPWFVPLLLYMYDL